PAMFHEKSPLSEHWLNAIVRPYYVRRAAGGGPRQKLCHTLEPLPISWISPLPVSHNIQVGSLFLPDFRLSFGHKRQRVCPAALDTALCLRYSNVSAFNSAGSTI